MIHTDTTKTAAFTGHRFIRYNDRQRLRTELERAITLLAMKVDRPDIRLTAVIPFRGQSYRFNPTDKERYRSILGKVDNVVCLSETYFDGCYLRRNDYMLNHASHIIAYYNGEPKGGTFYTCRRAEHMDLEITNLY